MRDVSLRGENLTKTYNRRTVFRQIDFAMSGIQSWAIVGRNGSGKSTLVKIIAGLLSPTSGDVILTIDGKAVRREDQYKHVGFVSPYLQMYEEFTAYENLALFSRLRSETFDAKRVDDLLRRIALYERRDDLVRTFSSGMKQRLKYAFGILHEPPVLILDEPTTNLDTDGIELVAGIIAEQRTRGIAIIASNDKEDTDRCDAVIDLNAAKSAKSRGSL